MTTMLTILLIFSLTTLAFYPRSIDLELRRLIDKAVGEQDFETATILGMALSSRIERNQNAR